MAWSTILGWSAICSMSMPCGTARMNSSFAAPTALPKSRMFAPFAMTTPTPRAITLNDRTSTVRRGRAFR
jgi:hypothetical protein